MVAKAVAVLRGSAWMLLPHMPTRDSYTRADMRRDWIAGSTVAAVLIPQSIGYALLAGLPPVHGLYAALLGGIAGSLWGSSRHLATGPIAIVSLLTLTAVAQLATPGSPEFIALVAALALMVGGIQITLGLARLGYLARLVPQSVLIGFSSAAALIITLTQLPHLLGYPSASGEFVYQMVENAFSHAAGAGSISAFVGCLTLAILFLLRRAYPKLPAALLVLVGGIVASYWFDLGTYGVELAGSIPARLPISDIPSLSPELILALGGKAFVIALVGFMSSYAIVKEYSSRTKESVSADQELIGQGFANIFAGLFRGYPVGGSLSRTAVNYEAGAATAWSGVYASIIVALAILIVSPAFAYIPNAVIAAIVIAAVVQLVDIPHMHRIHKVSRVDGMIAGVTFAAALLLRPSDAVFIGVILALVLFLHRMMWADVVEVGIDPKWNVLRAIPEGNTAVERLPRTLVLRIGSAFFYGNSEGLIEQIKAKLSEREVETGESIECLVLECAGIDFIDATGVEGLEEFLGELQERDTILCLIYPRKVVRAVVARTQKLSKVTMLHNIAELRRACGKKETFSDVHAREPHVIS